VVVVVVAVVVAVVAVVVGVVVVAGKHFNAHLMMFQIDPSVWKLLSAAIRNRP